MSLLVFAILAIVLGSDLRRRSLSIAEASNRQGALHLCVRQASTNVIGAWMSLAGGICLNLAVWSLF